MGIENWFSSKPEHERVEEIQRKIESLENRAHAAELAKVGQQTGNASELVERFSHEDVEGIHAEIRTLKEELEKLTHGEEPRHVPDDMQ